MMGEKSLVMIFTFMIVMLLSMPPIYACSYCAPPRLPYRGPSRPIPRPHPQPTPLPYHGGRGAGGGGGLHKGGGGGGGHKGGGGGGGHGPIVLPPIVTPPSVITPPVLPPLIITPPIITLPTPTPPVINPPIISPPSMPTYPPYIWPPDGGGIIPSPPTTPPSKTCPINALKLGLCLDVLGGLIHIGLGNPVENTCCPVIQGLLELEAAVCLCMAIRLKLLNINLYIPLALQALITCRKNPSPPGFVCPPL